MFLLTEKYSIPLPIPHSLHNSTKNYIISLSELVRWLGRKSMEAGVEIYPGFAAAELIYDKDKVIGVATNDVGLDRNNQVKVKHLKLSIS